MYCSVASLEVSSVAVGSVAVNVGKQAATANRQMMGNHYSPVQCLASKASSVMKVEEVGDLAKLKIFPTSLRTPSHRSRKGHLQD